MTLLTQRSVMADAMASLHTYSQQPQNQGLTLIELSWAVRYGTDLPAQTLEVYGDGSLPLAAAADLFTRTKGHRSLTCTIQLLNGQRRSFTAYSV